MGQRDIKRGDNQVSLPYAYFGRGSIPTTLHCLTYIIPLSLAPREAPKIRMWLNSGHSNPFPIPGNRKGIRVIAVKIQTPAKMYRLSAREEILVHSIIKEQRTKSPCI